MLIILPFLNAFFKVFFEKFSPLILIKKIKWKKALFFNEN